MRLITEIHKLEEKLDNIKNDKGEVAESMRKCFLKAIESLECLVRLRDYK